MFLFGQQHVIFDVEDPGGVVGALQMQAEPSNRSEVSCTNRRNFASSSRVVVPLPQVSCRSIQAELMVSHISEVSAVRNERELSRAFSIQLRIEEGLFGENDRKSTTLRSSATS